MAEYDDRFMGYKTICLNGSWMNWFCFGFQLSLVVVFSSHLLVHAPPESIVLLEDIDCIFRRHDSSSPSSGDSVPPPTPQSRTGYHQGVSLSGLLNALDGVASGVGGYSSLCCF